MRLIETQSKKIDDMLEEVDNKYFEYDDVVYSSKIFYLLAMIIVDYGAGNLTSVYNALAHLGIKSEISANPERIEKANKIIFPGVGAARAAMENLNKSGIGEAIKKAFERQVPILGICIGCQIILDESEEDGGVQCLGLLRGRVVKFKEEPDLKIPHIGWNQADYTKEHPIFKGIPSGSNFYFVHSYHPQLNAADCYATTTYGLQTFPCAIGKGSLIATQFHLEKSGELGLQVLRNFLHFPS
jgi:glutamine amidotransferase